MMWVFGAIVMLGLRSFNLPGIRVDGSPTLPYLLAGIGYPGLLLVTLAFCLALPCLDGSTQVIG
jgi:nitric oxide reductase subunit B